MGIVRDARLAFIEGRILPSKPPKNLANNEEGDIDDVYEEKATGTEKAHKWGKESIIALLDKNDEAVRRALVLIYENQTDTEKFHHSTKILNNQGFNKNDAQLLTKFAEWYKEKSWLSPKQLAVTRKRIKKYWRQLAAAANDCEKSYTPEG